MQENKTMNNAQNGATEEEQLIEQARIRREKLAKLVAEGKNPYEQVKYPVDAHSKEIKNNFEAFRYICSNISTIKPYSSVCY